MLKKKTCFEETRKRKERGEINFNEEGEKKMGLWGEKRLRLEGLWMNATDR